MEKRKKLPIFVEDGTYHMDVEEYETKKSTFRHKWGYFAVIAFVVVIIYIQFQSKSNAKQTKSPSKFIEPSIVNSTHIDAFKPINPSRSIKRIARIIENHPIAADSVNVSSISRRLESTENANQRKLIEVIEDTISEAELQAKVDAQIDKVRRMKTVDHIVMETSDEAKKEIAILQDLVRSLIRKQYGTGPLRVEMKLLFPQSMSQPVLPQERTIVIDLAPITLVPYSVYYFLELVKYWKVNYFITNYYDSFYSFITVYIILCIFACFFFFFSYYVAMM